MKTYSIELDEKELCSACWSIGKLNEGVCMLIEGEAPTCYGDLQNQPAFCPFKCIDVSRDARLARIIYDIMYMAQRYADGRASYATSMFNSALDEAIALGVFKQDEIPYAKDAMFGEWDRESGRWRKPLTTNDKQGE